MSEAKITRTWDMPSAETFSCQSIGNFVKRYLANSKCSIDPFSRNKRLATYTNDINPETSADHHLDAESFLSLMRLRGVRCDLGILDPPYSPRQISEAYAAAGLKAGMKDTQNSALYKRVRDALMPILSPGAFVLSFGWNTVGMGLKRGFKQIEIQLVCHGGAHNDTICLAEQLVTHPTLL